MRAQRWFRSQEGWKINSTWSREKVMDLGKEGCPLQDMEGVYARSARGEAK